MVIYIVNLFSVFLWYFLISLLFHNQTRKNKYILMVTTIQMILIAGLRDVSVGVDTRGYQSIYNWCKEIDFKSLSDVYMEIGYVLLNKIVALLFDNYQALLLVIALFIYITIANFIYKTSNKVFSALILFITIGYYSSSLNVMRQFIGLAFVLIAYYYFIWKKQIRKSIVALVIGFLFHDSVIITFPLLIVFYIMTNDRFKSKNAFKFLVVLGGIGCTLGIDEIAKLIDLLGIKSIDDLQENGSSSGMFSILMKIVFIVLYICNRKAVESEEERYQLDFLNYCTVFSIFINIMSMRFSLVGRFNIYMAFLLVIFIPKVLDLTFRDKVNRFLAYSGVYIILVVMYLIDLPNSGIVPWAMFSN